MVGTRSLLATGAVWEDGVHGSSEVRTGQLGDQRSRAFQRPEDDARVRHCGLGLTLVMDGRLESSVAMGGRLK